jgi:hypothetical protein
MLVKIDITKKAREATLRYNKKRWRAGQRHYGMKTRR